MLKYLIKISERYSIDLRERQYENELPKMTDKEYNIWFSNSVNNMGVRIGYKVVNSKEKIVNWNQL